MRFALFTTTFFPTLGGAEKQLDLLARGLLARGHEPFVIAPEVRGKNNQFDAPYPVHRYPRLRSKQIGLRWHARFMESLHRRHHFEMIHAHGAYPAAYMVADFARHKKVPLIVRAYGGDVLPGEAIASSAWLLRRLRYALRASNLLIAQNAELESLLAKLSGGDIPVVRIPNGVETTDYATCVTPNPWLESPPFAFTLSTFYKKKGLDVLLRAWVSVIRNHPNARLKLAGHGPDGLILRALASQLGIAETIDFLEDVKGEEKVRLLQACSVYVSSARREPFSNALLEAVAAGCRVVATRTGGNTEIVETTQCGELVPTEDEVALAAALSRALEMPRTVQTVAQRLERIRPYALDLMLERYLAAVLSLSTN